MVQLFIVLFTLSLSKDLPVKKQLYTESTTGHVISTIGYYDILVRGGETITGILSNGDNRLFLVIPSHLQISIEEIIIDNHPVPEFSDKKGFIINGKENVTFRINSSDSNAILRINAWLLPNQYCTNSAIYAYGSRRIRYEKVLSIQEFCIFSPTLDSKNDIFDVNYGIKKSSKLSYGSSLYKLDFETPEQTTIGEEISQYEANGPYYIQFDFDNQANNETIIYERKTKAIKFTDIGNKCTINSFYRCSIINNEIECNDDQTVEYDSKICSGLTISKMALGLSIAAVSLAMISAIAGIVLCSCCCNCCACCCCNKYHKSRNNSKKNE